MFANAVVQASGRRVDRMHIPLLERSDDASRPGGLLTGLRQCYADIARGLEPGRQR
jgi:hypothetical protein